MSFPYEEELEVCLQERVPAVSFFWGDPSPHVERFHAVGATVLLQVGSDEEARRAVHAGVDIIVAQGWEAGGHVRGDVATLPLVPSVVDAVAPVPESPLVASSTAEDWRPSWRWVLPGPGSAHAFSPAKRFLCIRTTASVS